MDRDFQHLIQKEAREGKDPESLKLANYTSARVAHGYPRFIAQGTDPRFNYDQFAIRILTGTTVEQHGAKTAEVIQGALLNFEFGKIDKPVDGYVAFIDLFCGVDGKHRLCKCSDELARTLVAMEDKLLDPNWRSLVTPIGVSDIFENYIASEIKWSIDFKEQGYVIRVPAHLISKDERGNKALLALSSLSNFYSSALVSDDGIEFRINSENPDTEGLEDLRAKSERSIAQAVLRISDWRNNS